MTYRILLTGTWNYFTYIRGECEMHNGKELFFSSEPLPESDASVTLDIYSEEDVSRGFELPQKRMLEGRVTLNPPSCLIFFIPPAPVTASQPLITPDRTKWDLYLVSIPFTLHRAPGNRYYQEVTFFIELTNSEATAFDLFPNNITTKIEETRTYSLSPQLKFQEVEASLGQVSKQMRFSTMRPTITAFGRGESRFYWVYEGFEEQKQVTPETKQALVVLQIPHGTHFVDVTISYEVVTALKLFGAWQSRSGTVDPYHIRLELRDVLPLFITDTSQTKRAGAPLNHTYFDVCIVCAMPEEAEACIKEISRQCDVSFHKAFSPHTNREYRHTVIQNKKGERLTIHVSWSPGYGLIETGLHIRPILDEFRPRFVAMTGICAGDKRKVKLGDIIVAERAFAYDTGKFLMGEDGRQEYERDTDTWHPQPDVLQFVRMFDDWKSAVADLKRPYSRYQQRDWLLSKLLEASTPRLYDIEESELNKYAPDWRGIIQELQTGANPYLTREMVIADASRVRELRYAEVGFPFKDPSLVALHIAPMASGSAVRSDNPFNSVRIPVRGTVAIDMEGASFYRTVADFPGIHALLVKGVCDYSDGDKDDSYHQYASSVSATYMLCFIREYVNVDLMPGL